MIQLKNTPYETIIAFRNLCCSIVGAHNLAGKTGKIKTLEMQFLMNFKKSYQKDESLYQQTVSAS